MNVEIATLNEIQSDLSVLRLALENLQAKVDRLLSQQQKAIAEGRPTKLIDLKGIWEGADFSYEDIKAAEYTIPEDLL
jgi:hypothetical protein